MPPKTNTEKIDELYRLVYAHAQQADNLESAVAQLKEALDKAETRFRQELIEFRREMKETVSAAKREAAEEVNRFRDTIQQLRVELAVQRRDLDDLRAKRDEWGRRAWAILGILIGGAITYLLKR